MYLDKPARQVKIHLKKKHSKNIQQYNTSRCLISYLLANYIILHAFLIRQENNANREVICDRSPAGLSYNTTNHPNYHTISWDISIKQNYHILSQPFAEVSDSSAVLKF